MATKKAAPRRTKQPVPPFPRQHQKRPGIESEMSPRPRYKAPAYRGADKLKGKEIPLAARIVAIADAYDAMATERPYKAALPLEECEKILRKCGGNMYDPDLIEIFIQRKVGELYRDDYEGLDHGYDALDAG